MGKSKGRKEKKSVIMKVVIVILFIVGAGIYLYPTISDAWNTYRNSQLISNYDTSTDGLSDERKQEMWDEAEAYNEQHTVNTIVDAFNEDDEYVLSHPYDDMLDPNGDGLMGYIEIPKLDLILPIYHGLGSESLEKGVGHVEGTSLPIGGESTHSVLAGHRGLPTAKLFTDLDLMEEGDIFIIRVLDHVLAYKVDQRLTVLPEKSEALGIVPGEDHVTLVTCTPYGVNTHRLLVRGIRTEYTEDIQNMEEESENRQNAVDPVKVLILGAIALAVIIFIIVIVSKRKKNKEERNIEENKKDESLKAEITDNNEIKEDSGKQDQK